MPIYVIEYDLRKQGQNYSALIQQIESYGYYCKPLQSTWYIVSQKTTAQIRDHLVQYIDANDSLMITRVHKDMQWRNMPENISKWFQGLPEY